MFIDLYRWWWYFLYSRYNGRTGCYTMGSKYLENNPGSELNLFLWTKWKAKESNENKVEQNKRTTIIKSRNNNKIIYRVRDIRKYIFFIYRKGGEWFSHITSSRDWKWTVNMTLAKGHHAETRCTARNFLIFHTIAVRPINKLYIIICGWGRRHSQVRFPAIQL